MEGYKFPGLRQGMLKKDGKSTEDKGNLVKTETEESAPLERDEIEKAPKEISVSTNMEKATQGKGPGRPKKPTELLKSEPIRVYFSPSEEKEVRRFIKEKRLSSLSEFIRKITLEKIRKGEDTDFSGD